VKRVRSTDRVCQLGRKADSIGAAGNIVGDKPVSELTADDAIDYCEWWRERVIAEETDLKTANKDIGQLSRMLKDLNIRRRLGLADIFKGLRIKGETARPRVPFTTDFIQNQLFAPGALDGLNEDARLVLYVIADTGLRPSEVVNLQAIVVLSDIQSSISWICHIGSKQRPNDLEGGNVDARKQFARRSEHIGLEDFSFFAVIKREVSCAKDDDFRPVSNPAQNSSELRQ
jgi:hypothetical protein